MKKTITTLTTAAALLLMLTACAQEEPAETLPETAPMETIGEAFIQAEELVPAESGGLDNFSVDSESVEAFAREVQSAVKDRDLEALANLASYPLYVGFPEGSVSVNDAAEFIALGADRIFTPELVESIEGAETAGLAPSMAGFALSKEGKPNIVFGVRDGVLAVVGMNY